MKKMNFKNFAFVIAGLLMLCISATSCSKDKTVNPDEHDTGGNHKVDPNLVGKWMWTSGSDAGYYDNNGVYSGSAYGFALQFAINADGTGTCFDHISSTLGGSTFTVDISYKGYYESDDQGNTDFYSTGGTYKSSSGTNRSLRSDEVWNAQTGTGAHFDLHDIVLTTQGQRVCFNVTGSDGKVSTFYKVP